MRTGRIQIADQDPKSSPAGTFFLISPVETCDWNSFSFFRGIISNIKRTNELTNFRKAGTQLVYTYGRCHGRRYNIARCGCSWPWGYSRDASLAAGTAGDGEQAPGGF